MRDTPKKNLFCILEDYPGHERQRKTEDLFQKEGNYRNMTIKCNCDSGGDSEPEGEKRYQGYYSTNGQSLNGSVDYMVELYLC